MANLASAVDELFALNPQEVLPACRRPRPTATRSSHALSGR